VFNESLFGKKINDNKRVRETFEPIESHNVISINFIDVCVKINYYQRTRLSVMDISTEISYAPDKIRSILIIRAIVKRI